MSPVSFSLIASLGSHPEKALDKGLMNDYGMSQHDVLPLQIGPHTLYLTCPLPARTTSPREVWRVGV